MNRKWRQTPGVGSRGDDGRPQASTGIPVSLVGTLIVSIPTFVLLFAVQRFFVSGLRVTA